MVTYLFFSLRYFISRFANFSLIDFLNSLTNNQWTLVKSPGGAFQFEALNGTLDYPDPFNNTFRHATMLVSDLALLEDPIYGPITKSWATDFPALTNAFAAAWCKYSCAPLFCFDFNSLLNNSQAHTS